MLTEHEISNIEKVLSEETSKLNPDILMLMFLLLGSDDTFRTRALDRLITLIKEPNLEVSQVIKDIIQNYLRHRLL